MLEQMGCTCPISVSPTPPPPPILSPDTALPSDSPSFERVSYHEQALGGVIVEGTEPASEEGHRHLKLGHDLQGAEPFIGRLGSTG